MVIVVKNKSSEKYNKILEAAVKVFAANGFFQSTIAQIAREAGVADGTIYLYFKNKDDILFQFFNYKTKQVFQQFSEAVELADNPIDKLRNLVRSHLKAFQQDRDMAILYQTETHKYKRIADDRIKEMSKMYLDIISDIIEQGQQEGCIRKDLYLGLVKRFIVGSVDEVINTWLHADGQYELVSMADPLIELFIRGIGSRER
jgi:TetR/AcrR family fatty acid metabolism transcriptional regulator